jgi:3-dehydroquinate dehydratase-2
MRILVINGPNLNLLGTREPAVYGTETLVEINGRIERHAQDRGVAIEFFQSNHEGEIVDRIQDAAREGSSRCDGIVINPGAYTHYSLAIRDAVSGAGLPTVEVHLSNIYAREPERRKSVIAPVCLGQISGLGYRGYLLAVDFLCEASE